MDIPKERPANADETLVTSEIAVITVASIVVLISIVLRFTGRWILEQRVVAGKGRSNTAFGLDDVFSILATICFFSLVAAVSIAIKRGMGTHVQLILYERGFHGLTEYNQAIFVSSIFYNSVLGFIKLSVLALYQRILRGVQGQRLNQAVWILALIVAANTIANVCVCIVQCWPIQAAWDVTIPANKKRCVDINAFYLGNAITGVITDALVYFLSIPIVKPLQMDTKLKLQLLATMLIGGFAVITSAVRLGFIPSLLKDPDISMAMGIPMNWSIAEPAVGILVSSMPAIRAIRFLWRKPGDDSYGSGYGQSTLRSRQGQIELHDVNILETKTDLESAKTRDPDNDSEEQLVMVGNRDSGKITRTTHLDIKYSNN